VPRGTNLEISYEFKSPSTCKNGCFNPPWTKLFVLICKTFSFCEFARAENAILQATTLCGFTNPTVSTIDALKNRMVSAFNNVFNHNFFFPFLHNLNFKNEWKKTMKKTILDPSFHLGSPNLEPPFSFILKALNPIYGFQPIGLLHFVGPSPLDPPIKCP
jgi:hypothetical protein